MIAITWVLQLLTALTFLAALSLALIAAVDGRFLWMLANFVLMGVNAAIFVFQGHLRAKLFKEAA